MYLQAYIATADLVTLADHRRPLADVALAEGRRRILSDVACVGALAENRRRSLAEVAAPE